MLNVGRESNEHGFGIGGQGLLQMLAQIVHVDVVAQDGRHAGTTLVVGHLHAIRDH